ncbi:OLC1v1003653C1 [Oldenlandia corymbosa var. corymbosa]|uniref:OLC1v1003653C1 n=1 Tax=Oldenlandia corymbosa var. corymbosa TaxID=529605 RepID=A0AAV1DAI5_OLDCO|nr:OLC1v1003653C1 [Oldenlandia corymbosa var. corymbosa]
MAIMQEEKLPKRKNSSPHLSGIVIKVKPQAKKARTDPTRATSSPEGTAHDSKTCDGDKVKTKVAENNIIRTELDQPHVVNSLGSLVSYSDGSDEDDE